MKARHLLAVALLAFGTTAPTAHAASAAVTLTGTGSGWVDVAFPTAFRIDAGLDSVSTSGSYAGYALQTLGGEVLTGEVRLAEPHNDVSLAPNFDPGEPPDFGRTDFPAGTYRLHLLTDGTSTVRFTAVGLGTPISRTVRRASGVTAGVFDLGTATTATRRVTVVDDGSTFVVLHVAHSSLVGAAVVPNACIRPDATSDCPVTGSSLAALAVSSEVSTSRSFQSGDLPDGTSYGVMQVTAAAVAPRATAFYLVLDY